VRLPTRTGILLALGIALVALPTVATGGTSAPTRATANSATFQDSTGEDPAAPDISTIVVSNDDAGTITFRVTIANRPTLTRDVAFFMFVDSDANQATGDPESLGADHIIQLLLGEVLLFRWDGSDYTLSATQSSLNFAWASGVTLRINASDLNNTRRFAFDTNAISGIVFDDLTGSIDCSACARDFAPTIGFFTFDVKIAPPTLQIRRFTTTPARPAAGKSFTARLTAVRSDTGAVIQNGRVTCVGRAGAARLRVLVARVVAGAATCTWGIPPNARGKVFRGTVSISFEGLRATRSYSSRIR
jgi:hypothetical protein